MIRLKAGVRLNGLRPEMLVAVATAEGIWSSKGLPLVITSAGEGKHKRSSKHYIGAALDFRTKEMDVSTRQAVVKDLGDALGAGVVRTTARTAVYSGPEFDVILEQNHCHVEFDVKGEA